jgi:hypothetical protein
MIKSIIFILLSLFSFSCFAATPATCSQALPTNNPGFCASFKSVAECHCTASGLPRGMCTNMSLLYDRMISIFGSIQKACEYQHDTDTQTCVDDWNCYRSGGNDSHGRQCSSTGKACQ